MSKPDFRQINAAIKSENVNFVHHINVDGRRYCFPYQGRVEEGAHFLENFLTEFDAIRETTRMEIEQEPPKKIGELRIEGRVTSTVVFADSGEPVVLPQQGKMKQLSRAARRLRNGLKLTKAQRRNQGVQRMLALLDA